MIVVGSAFRNCAPAITRYFKRIDALQEHAQQAVRIIAVEGDSVDRTRELLSDYTRYFDLDIITCNHGKRKFSSTEDADRLVALSKVGNAIFGGVRDTDDVLLYVESDLLWDPHHVGTLIDCAAEKRYGIDVWGPVVMAGAAFYDVWGFRHLDGARFSPFENESYTLGEVVKNDLGLAREVLPYCELSSVGSCLAMRAEIARQVRITDDYCLVGWCKNARVAGYRIGIHWGAQVNHP